MQIRVGVVDIPQQATEKAASYRALPLQEVRGISFVSFDHGATMHDGRYPATAASVTDLVDAREVVHTPQ